MTTLKSRLPVIAIALAIVAAGMLTAAIVMRRRKAEEAAPAPATAKPVDTPRPDAALVAPVPAPDPWTPPPDDTIATPSNDAGTCIPCQGCRPTTCTCNDGSVTSSFHCVNGCCLSALETCDKVCASRNGVSPP